MSEPTSPAPAARAAPPGEPPPLPDDRLAKLTDLCSPISHGEVLSLIAEVRAGRAEAGKLREERDRAERDLQTYRTENVEHWKKRAREAKSAVMAERDASLASAARLRERVEALAKEWETYAIDVWDEQPHTAQDYDSHAKALRAALRAETKETP